MDYKKAAQQVLDNIGGASNIVSAAHCATRLRLVIADNSKVNKKELENAEGDKHHGTSGPSRRWAISLFPSSRPSWLPAF